MCRCMSHCVCSPNACDVEDGEAQLLAHNRWGHELVHFYQGKGLHRQALEHLMRRVSEQGEAYVPHNLEKMVSYLQGLGPRHEALVFEWVPLVFGTSRVYCHASL
jgi:hypothetical protein